MCVPVAPDVRGATLLNRCHVRAQTMAGVQVELQLESAVWGEAARR
jgi:hypothetical protein